MTTQTEGVNRPCSKCNREENQETSRSLQLKQKRRKYYEDNRYSICHKTLNVYCIKKIKSVRSLCADRVGDYMMRYPFENCTDGYIKKQLRIYRVHSSHSHYDDCYDAGMMAYMYSIHRCAEMSYNHVEQYIKKLVRIYIVCALVIHNDTKNLCRENGFTEVRLDSEAAYGRY